MPLPKPIPLSKISWSDLYTTILYGFFTFLSIVVAPWIIFIWVLLAPFFPLPSRIGKNNDYIFKKGTQ